MMQKENSYKLYKLSERLLSILSEVEENEGELTEELEKSLVITQENFEAEVKESVEFIKETESFILYGKSEISRIASLIKGKATVIGRLKNSVLEAIKLYGMKDEKKNIWRYATGTFKLGTTKSISTEILDENDIEDKWKRLHIGNLSLEDKAKILDAIGKGEEEVKITIDIFKTPIKEALQRGEIVEGASLVDNYSLRIK